jgi:hypothetical protein
VSKPAQKLRLPAGRPAAAVNAPEGYLRRHRRDVLGELTGKTGYVPVASAAIDEHWTALRFRRRA